MATDGSPITRRLAEFTADLQFDDLTEEVVDEAKRGLLDTIGVALAGSRERGTQILLDVTGSRSFGGTATVVGTDVLATAPLAALVNGYAAHVLDYDDTQHRVGTHMSAPVVAAALSLAEVFKKTGKDLVAAYVAGFEVGCRLGRAGQFARHLSKRGIHATGYLGHLGATAASARLAGLDALHTRRGFGIAAGYASGTVKSFGTMGKAQNAANAAQNGVYSALLAADGFTGPEDIFDGEGSIFSMCGGETDIDEMFDGLGSQFEVTTNTRKGFACAGWRNPIVEACILLATKHELKPNDLDRVKVWAASNVAHLPNYPVPSSGLESKFSAQYAAAIALVDRAGGLQQFSDERVVDQSVIEVCRRVELGFDKDFDPFQIRLEIRTNDGLNLSHFVPEQKGDYTNPLTWDDLEAKFEANASAVLAPQAVGTLVAQIRGIEALENVADLTQLCRSDRSG